MHNKPKERQPFAYCFTVNYIDLKNDLLLISLLALEMSFIHFFTVGLLALSASEG